MKKSPQKKTEQAVISFEKSDALVYFVHSDGVHSMAEILSDFSAFSFHYLTTIQSTSQGNLLVSRIM